MSSCCPVLHASSQYLTRSHFHRINLSTLNITDYSTCAASHGPVALELTSSSSSRCCFPVQQGPLHQTTTLDISLPKYRRYGSVAASARPQHGDFQHSSSTQQQLPRAVSTASGSAADTGAASQQKKAWRKLNPLRALFGSAWRKAVPLSVLFFSATFIFTMVSADSCEAWLMHR
jgi:hypothetical protein